jgi:hypothetical protein
LSVYLRHAPDSKFAAWLRSLEVLDTGAEPQFTEDVHLHVLGFLKNISGGGEYGGVSKSIELLTSILQDRPQYSYSMIALMPAIRAGAWSVTSLRFLQKKLQRNSLFLDENGRWEYRKPDWPRQNY